jgi:hypothetical protein
MTSEPDWSRMPTGGLVPSESGQPASRPARQRLIRTAAFALALGLGAAPLLAACSSAPAHAAGSPSSALSAACAHAGAALSDGPDPDADPVGYAEAQIKPLRAITTSDHALRTALSDLATAYAKVFDADGKNAAAAKAVVAASKKLNAICPGATS